jgi:PAS domain S-box-containing protein
VLPYGFVGLALGVALGLNLALAPWTGGHVVPLVTIALVSFGAVAVMASLRAARNRAEAAAREAKRCEADLRAAEERLRLSIDALTDYAVLMVNPDRRIASWNAGAERINGYRADEIIGWPVSTFYERADVESGRVDAAFDEAAETGRHEEEGWRVRKDGSRFLAHSVLAPVRGGDGALRGFIKVVRDITERRRIADALRESEAKFRGLVEAAPDGIVMAGSDGRIVLVNAQAATMLGYTRDELVGASVETLLPEVLRSRHVGHRAIYQATPATRPMGVGAHLVARRKDGTELPVEISLSPMSAPQGVLVIAVIRDVSERQRAEAALHASELKFRGLVDAAPDGIVIVRSDGRIDLVNAQAARLFGYTPDELVGQLVEVLLPEPLRGGHVGHRTGYVAAPTTRPMGAGRHLVGLRKDGTEFPVEISLSPMPTAEGMLVISVIRDVTERTRTEEQIQTLNENLRAHVAELDAVNQELEAFSYSVSHDLRAPLRGIDGFSQALLEDYADQLDGQGRDYLHRIRAASQRMADLIDDLLDLSRVTRREMRRERVDLTALARTVVSQLERAEPERKVEWVIDEGVTALGDGALLRLVLENLLGNAWKFTSKQATARIEFRAVPHKGGVAYAVRDNGVGFDMAHASKMFGAFQRLHAMHEFPGTGIGLAIVQRVVHRHGGRVWAEAVLGTGATLYFTV